VGLRFQRRIKILPGLHLNLSRSGIGFSVGGRGAHVGITAKGRKYASVGIPDSGISWREYERSHRIAPPCPHCTPGQAHIPLWLVVAVLLVFAVAALIVSAGK
jgi:hypothetical protein